MTEQHDIIAAQREQISGLLRIIGAHTPIAAFDLATTWQAEKALMQDEIAALEAEIRANAEAVQALIHAARNPSHDHWNDWVHRLRVLADRAALDAREG